MGRVETHQKAISKSSPLVPATYQGCLQYYWGHFGEGPGVWGGGPILTRFWQGNGTLNRESGRWQNAQLNCATMK